MAPVAMSTPIDEPLDDLMTAGTQPADGVGLCLSGGGYRAMLFHLGALWRLLDAGLLPQVTRVASVSGGSIAAAQLALGWDASIREGRAGFVREVVAPLRALAATTIQYGAILGGIALPGTIGDYVAKAYAKRLFGEKTLQDLPDAPRFVFNATSLETGALFRFSKPYAREWRVGKIDRPRFRLADVVAASSAFPPFLSPFVLDVSPGDFAAPAGGEIGDDRFREDISLTDGGVYDNLGLEPVWKSCRTLFVSDGGGRMADDPSPPADWARQLKRVLDLVDHQVRNLRKRQLIDSFTSGARQGAYWGIRTDIADYPTHSAFACPHDATMKLASVATGLKRLDDDLQERLINWGFAVTDAALRSRYDPGIAPAGKLPYHSSGIG